MRLVVANNPPRKGKGSMRKRRKTSRRKRNPLKKLYRNRKGQYSSRGKRRVRRKGKRGWANPSRYRYRARRRNYGGSSIALNPGRLMAGFQRATITDALQIGLGVLLNTGLSRRVVGFLPAGLQNKVAQYGTQIVGAGAIYGVSSMALSRAGSERVLVGGLIAPLADIVETYVRPMFAGMSCLSCGLGLGGCGSCGGSSWSPDMANRSSYMLSDFATSNQVAQARSLEGMGDFATSNQVATARSID